MSEPPLFVDTELPSVITEFALQVTSNLEGHDHFASGTAVIVAPYVALAARHVLDQHWQQHEGRRMPDAPAGGKFSLIMVQVVEGQVNAWFVSRFWPSDVTDIVALQLSPYSQGAKDYKFRHLSINLLPPKVGERISGFGYRENVTSYDQKNIELRVVASNSHGNVVEVHDRRRDSGLLSFPCFRTNARFDGGMSGGPVFNASGQLCGLICAGLPPDDPDQEHTSYVVSLWPAAAILLDLNRLDHPSGVAYPLVEILAASNADLLKIETLESGDRRVSLNHG